MLKNFIKSLFVAGFALAIFSISTFAQDGVRHEAKSFKLEGFSRTGNREWILEGEWAEMVREKILFSKIKAMGMYEDVSLTLTADKGVYDKKTEEVKLQGSVEARTSDGGYLSTEEASWNMGKQEFTSDIFVKVIKDGIVSMGKGVVAHSRLKQASFREDVRVEVPPATVITCDGPFDIYYNEQKAVFNNNVKVKDKSGELTAERLIAFFDPETHEIERVIVTGGVKVIRHKGKGGDFFNAPAGD